MAVAAAALEKDLIIPSLGCTGTNPDITKDLVAVSGRDGCNVNPVHANTPITTNIIVRRCIVTIVNLVLIDCICY